MLCRQTAGLEEDGSGICAAFAKREKSAGFPETVLWNDEAVDQANLVLISQKMKYAVEIGYQFGDGKAVRGIVAEKGSRKDVV